MSVLKFLPKHGILKHLGIIGDHATQLNNVGTNTHAQIDTHISATSAHGVTGNIIGYGDARYKAGVLTYDRSSTGNVSITGIGFQPKALIIAAAIRSGAGTAYTILFYDGTNARAIYFNPTQSDDATTIRLHDASGVSILSMISLDSDGWTGNRSIASGSPTGTGVINYIAFR